MTKRIIVLLAFCLLLLGAGQASAQQVRGGSTAFTAGGMGGVFSNRCGDDNVCDVVNFHADPTGGTDSEPAMSAAMTASLAAGYNSIYIPAGTYKLDFPMWVKGSAAHSNFSVTGAGGASFSTNLTGNYMLLAPYNFLSVIDGGCGTGNLWTAPLAGATGQSLCADSDWWLDLKQIQFNGNTDVPLNGLAAFDVQFWYKAGNSSGGNILWSAGTDGSVAQATHGAIGVGYQWNGASGTIQVFLRTSGGLSQPTSGTLSNMSGAHFYEVSYDGANIRIFQDGTQTGSSTPLTGTLVDQPYDSLSVDSAQDWPVHSAGAGFNGQLFGLRLSKVARNVANYTAPTAALGCDPNTLLLLNGTKVNSDEGVSSSSGPFVQPECMNGAATAANVWLLMHGSSTSAAASMTVEGVRISNSTADGYDMVWNGTINSAGRDIHLDHSHYVAFIEENTSYFNTWYNLYADASTSGANAGAEFLWPGQVCDGCTFYTGHYMVVDKGGVIYRQAFATPAANADGCLVSLGAGSPNQTEELDQFACDNENGAVIPIVSTNTPNVSSIITSTAGGSPVTFRLGNNVNLKIDNNNLTSGSGMTSWTGAGFGLSTIPNTVVRVDGGQASSLPLIRNPIPFTDGKGEAYEISGMGSTLVAGTTAGSASVSCPQFADNLKTCVANLTGYENATGTAQLVMLPAGVGSFGVVGAVTGSCTGVTVGAGSNAGCTANKSPYPCCTGSTTGTCDTLQFVTLPSSMGGTQTGQCQMAGF